MRDPYSTPEGIHWRIAMRPHLWRPPTDMYETEEAIVIRVEIAGMREQDFNVALEDRTLTIRGIRSDTSERRAFHQMEIPFGEFSTEVELPAPILARRRGSCIPRWFFANYLTQSPPAASQGGYLEVSCPLHVGMHPEILENG